MTIQPHSFVIALLLSLFSLTVQASSEAAHEHGIAELNLVQLNNQLQVEIISPAYNVFGFEHQPNTSEQKAKVKAQLKQIKTTELILFAAKAHCQHQSTEVNNPFHAKQHETHSHKAHHQHNHKEEHKHGHDHADAHEDEHEGAHKAHRNIHIQLNYTCQTPKALSEMQLAPLFQSWPQLEKLRAQWILGNQQSGITLTRQAPTARLQ